ncbi:MAG: 50S ribosomal protein L11 methyltransferase [Pyrinomonadaceae bacterium]|nr:50S ribosomal protein L11 methyltransferase [Pyrinomonadaceae bacterium]
MEDSQKHWYSVQIRTVRDASEAVEFALNELDSLGTEIDSLGKQQADDLVIVGYFDELPDLETVRNNLHRALGIYRLPENSIKSVEPKTVKDQDWLAEWKKHWKPTEIGKFIISPSWIEVEKTEKIVIKIEPNMAFGTGTHETTKLCLKAIEDNYISGMSFLDVGTGTGILSIAVSRLPGNGSAKIVGCDTDNDSVKIAHENAERNHAGNIEFYVGSVTRETPKFEFVCANMTADIILPLLPLLVEKSEKILVLSGILAEQENEVLDALITLGTSNIQTASDGEWISIVIKKG